MLRDIVLQEGPPLAFEHIAYLITAMIGALVAVLFGRWFSERTDRTIVVVDAAAIGLFAVAGTTRALDAGLRELAALLLGITTAVGGGSLRDVLSGRPPKIFERGQLYAVAALLGSAVFLLCDYYGFSRTASTAVGTSSCFLLRILAWRYDWRTPHIGTEDQT